MSIRPNWEEISLKLGNDISHEELNSAWIEESRKWLEAICKNYDGNYQIHESDNFYLVSIDDDKYVQIFSKFLEGKLKEILKNLNGIALDEGYGKHVVIIFRDLDQYYDYVFRFYPDEGEFGLSSGMFINDGYGHFVFPTQDISIAEPIAVHELTHACLTHLPIPTWLNEGLAVEMEDALAGNHLYLDKEVIQQHEQYWNNKTIQNFWNGDSFYYSDEGQDLSYNLAHVLVRNISKNYESFKEFTNNASLTDAGETAFLKSYGYSLSNAVQVFLGEGDWSPKNISI